MKLSFNLMDNWLLSIFFFFLPFNYALTVNLGFPLKISEVVLFVYAVLLVFKLKMRIMEGRSLLFLYLNLFVFFVLTSCLVNLFWEYDYPLNYFDSRFGYKVDSLLKFFYLLLAYFAFVISGNAFSANEDRYYKMLRYGAFTAAAYCWYLFIGSILDIPLFFLPGMDENPQALYYAGKVIVRCGTMKEGNYMGLFLFMTGVVACYRKDYKFAAIFFLTEISTLSTIAIVSSFIFCIFFFFKSFFTAKNMRQFFKYLSGLVLLLAFLLSFEEFRFILVGKIFSEAESVRQDQAVLSKADRLNSVEAAVKIGIDNPIFGVGLSNYGLHYREYYPDPFMYVPGYKFIVNNVYAEIFSETGVASLCMFLSFLACLFLRTLRDKSWVLTVGFLMGLIYLLTFPSFSMLYVWVFWGLLSSLKHKFREGSSKAVQQGTLAASQSDV